MICPDCKGSTKVIDTDKGEASIRRRRECKDCGFRFTTYEVHAVYLEALVKVLDAKVIEGLWEIGEQIGVAAQRLAELEKEVGRRMVHLRRA